MGIPIFGKFESKTTDGILVDAKAVGGLKEEISGIVVGGTVDSEWVEESTNPVQSQLIQAEIAKLREEISGTSIFVDSALSSTSKNPVQNKIIYEALKELRDDLSVAITQSVISFGETTFTYGISNELTNANKEVKSVSTSFNTGEIQRYSREGEIVEVELKTIHYEVLGAFKNKGDKILRVYDGSGNLIASKTFLSPSGNFIIDKSISVTKNTTLVFKLEGLVSVSNSDGTKTEKEYFSLTNSVRISFPVFYGLTVDSELPEDIKSANFTQMIAATLKGYTKPMNLNYTRFIWFLTTEDVRITSQGFDAGFQLWGTKTIGEVSFNCYRSASAIIPGLYNFKFD